MRKKARGGKGEEGKKEKGRRPTAPIPIPKFAGDRQREEGKVGGKRRWKKQKREERTLCMEFVRKFYWPLNLDYI